MSSNAATLRVALVIRDGGGTAPVELAVATKLRARGHHVTAYGPPETGPHAARAGFPLTPLPWPTPDHQPLLPRMAAAATSWATRLTAPLTHDTDVLVADCAAFGALLAARATGTPSAALMPTVYVAGPRTGPPNVDGGLLAELNEARRQAGRPVVSSLTEQVLDADRVLVLTSRAFELPGLDLPPHVRYAGPQVPRPAVGAGAAASLPGGDGPLVVVSLSTGEQGQLEVLRRLVDAVAALPVRVVVTVGPAVEVRELRAAPNTVLVPYLPHAEVLPHARLVVTHAGHGTVLAALSAGVPLVCLPMGRDQPAVAERVVRHGAGISVDPESGVDGLRDAIGRAVRDERLREGAARLSRAILAESEDLVVDEVEAVVR